MGDGDLSVVMRVHCVVRTLPPELEGSAPAPQAARGIRSGTGVPRSHQVPAHRRGSVRALWPSRYLTCSSVEQRLPSYTHTPLCKIRHLDTVCILQGGVYIAHGNG